jgi:hypothetical protein
MRRPRPTPLRTKTKTPPRPLGLGLRTIAFREQFRLSITEFVDLLKRHGFQTANPVSLHRWEKRGANASLVHEKIVTDAMDAIRTRITESLEKDDDPGDAILRLVIARLRTNRAKSL